MMSMMNCCSVTELQFHCQSTVCHTFFLTHTVLVNSRFTFKSFELFGVRALIRIYRNARVFDSFDLQCILLSAIPRGTDRLVVTLDSVSNEILEHKKASNL